MMTHNKMQGATHSRRINKRERKQPAQGTMASGRLRMVDRISS